MQKFPGLVFEKTFHKEGGTRMEYLLLALCFLVGVVIGILISKPKVIGSLRVDYSDPDGPYLFMELKKDGIKTIESSNYINLKVSIQSQNSHK